MKKLIIIFTVLFTSCQSEYTIYPEGKVISVKRYDKSLSRYEVESYTTTSENNKLTKTSYFVDSTGKFNVGDEIVINKK